MVYELDNVNEDKLNLLIKILGLKTHDRHNLDPRCMICRQSVNNNTNNVPMQIPPQRQLFPNIQLKCDLATSTPSNGYTQQYQNSNW